MLARLEVPVNLSADVLKRIISLIATASGWQGMVGGQAMDIQAEGKEIDSGLMDYIHSHKTGALITASVASGAILGGGSKAQLDSITIYGEKIGLAFQIADDILDVEATLKKWAKARAAIQKKARTPSLLFTG